MNSKQINFSLKTDYLICQKALQQYDITEYKTRLLWKGMNTTFLIHDQKNVNNQYVLRVSPKGWLNVEYINTEAKVIEYLNNFDDISTSKIIRNSAGELISVISLSKQAVQVTALFERISSPFYKDILGEEELKSIGRDIAKLHNHLFNFSESNKLARPTWDYNGIFGIGGILDYSKISNYLSEEQQQYCLKALKYLKIKLDKIKINRNNFGFIHGDTYYQNIYRNGNKNGFIDFDMCGWGYYLNDIYSFYWPEKQLELCSPNKLVIEGYGSVRPLPDYYDQFEHVFCILQHLKNICWIYSRNDIVNSTLIREQVIQAAMDVFRQYT